MCNPLLQRTQGKTGTHTIAALVDVFCRSLSVSRYMHNPVNVQYRKNSAAHNAQTTCGLRPYSGWNFFPKNKTEKQVHNQSVHVAKFMRNISCMWRACTSAFRKVQLQVLARVLFAKCNLHTERRRCGNQCPRSSNSKTSPQPVSPCP